MFALTLALLLAAAGYFVVTTLVNLAPLNNVAAATPRERKTEVSINAPAMVLPVLLVILAQVWAVPALGFAAGGIEFIIVAGGLMIWWFPYLFGITVPWAVAGTSESWYSMYARVYAKTINVLPRIGDRPRPNLEHMILHTLLLAGVVSAVVFAAQL